jgi:hypothetical protein
LALYELARLRRDVLGDANGALATLRSYARRFPSGAFRTEAAVTIVEILAAQGDDAGALAESERLLASGGAIERRSDLHALRARIFARRGDRSRAEAELAADGTPSETPPRSITDDPESTAR